MGNATFGRNWPTPPKPDPAGPEHWLLQAQLDRTSKPSGIRFRAQIRWKAAYSANPPSNVIRTPLERLIAAQEKRTQNPPPYFTRMEWEQAMDTLEELLGQHDALLEALAQACERGSGC